MKHILIMAVTSLALWACDNAGPETDTSAQTSETTGTNPADAATSDAGPTEDVTEDDRGNPADDVVTPSGTIDTFIADVAAAQCTSLFRCCNGADQETFFAAFLNSQRLLDAGMDAMIPPKAVLDETSCQQALIAIYAIEPFGGWVQAVKEERVSYDQAATDTCLDALNTSTCGEELSAALFDGTCFGFSPVSASYGGRSMFSRSAPIGDTCQGIGDGVGGAFYGTCAPDTGWCCRPREDGTPGCGLGLGVEGECVAAGQVGDSCGLFPELSICATGLECDVETSTCIKLDVLPMQDGDLCYEDYTMLGSCQGGFCDIFGTNTCQPLKGLDASCTYPYECESGYCTDGGQCAQPTFCSDPNLEVPEPEPVADANALTKRAARYLEGTFDSMAQSMTDLSYYNISLKLCRVSAPDYGPQVLYVEQAMASNPGAPYRQRLYVISPGAEAQTVVSAVYTPLNAASWVGTCDQSETVSVSAGAFTLKSGCEVYLTETPNGFEGGTEGQGCSSSLQGSSYATAVVTVSETQVTSWDQGFTSAGEQVWGAVAGPYVFDRKSPLLTEAEWDGLL